MTDPFANRLEDVLNKGIKAGVSMLPVVGSPLVEMLTFVIGDPAQERRDDFMRDTFERLSKLQEDFEQVKPENLHANEQFQATFLQAIRVASTTASQDKKRMLQNAIINSAIGSMDENIRHIFMQMIDEITPMHAVLLSFLSNPKAHPAAVAKAKSMMAGGMVRVIEAALPDLTSDDTIFDRVSGDLGRLGLADTGWFKAMMSGGDSMLQPRITNLGKSFLAFISAPEDKKSDD
ncbi:hypothetical protein KMZ29_14375 [Bradyrhizobium sediminis]|uniref:Uncharacterized protein n=1 Tax=Bradyrhizobium sediminis TaxID=2840469 RepID=A0A975NB31_9BRAD|nr:hypothetical protein [Bradyrhizobium sediminis]QWG10969.1 hypothetical protein KMZ29_14375 [Bradyrhizobium sediminis]